MIVTISKTFDFDAAHRLPSVPRGHKCRRMHGHTYRVEIVLSGEVDRRGMVVDYAEIAAVWQRVHDKIDHRTLNKIRGLENPTTEILAPWILRRVLRSPVASLRFRAAVEGVRVFESATTHCDAWKKDL